MNTFMNVKQATVEEIPALQALFQEAIEWQREKGMPTFATLSASFFEQEITNGAVFVSDENGRIVGSISLYEADDLIWDYDSSPALYIHRLVSLRGAQGRGVGANVEIGESRSPGRQSGTELDLVDLVAAHARHARPRHGPQM